LPDLRPVAPAASAPAVGSRPVAGTRRLRQNARLANGSRLRTYTAVLRVNGASSRPRPARLGPSPADLPLAFPAENGVAGV